MRSFLSNPWWSAVMRPIILISHGTTAISLMIPDFKLVFLMTSLIFYFWWVLSQYNIVCIFIPNSIQLFLKLCFAMLSFLQSFCQRRLLLIICDLLSSQFCSWRFLSNLIVVHFPFKFLVLRWTHSIVSHLPISPRVWWLMLKAKVLMSLHLADILPPRTHLVPCGLIFSSRCRLCLKVQNLIVLILVRIPHQLPSFLGWVINSLILLMLIERVKLCIVSVEHIVHSSLSGTMWA